MKICRQRFRQRNLPQNINWFKLVASRCNYQTFTLYDTHRYNPTCIHPYLYTYALPHMHVIFIPCTHQVLQRQPSGSGSDAMTPSPIKARASVDIYNLYGVTMPPYVEVQSSPERILSQAAHDDPAYDEHSEESSLKDMKPQVAPAYSSRRWCGCQ